MDHEFWLELMDILPATLLWEDAIAEGHTKKFHKNGGTCNELV